MIDIYTDGYCGGDGRSVDFETGDMLSLLKWLIDDVGMGVTMDDEDFTREGFGFFEKCVDKGMVAIASAAVLVKHPRVPSENQCGSFALSRVSKCLLHPLNVSCRPVFVFLPNSFLLIEFGFARGHSVDGAEKNSLVWPEGVFR